MKRALLGAAAAGLLGMTMSAAASSAPREANLIFVNGEIYTPKGWMQAFAVSGKHIVATGTSAAMRKLARSSTQIVDLRGRTVMPGFVDTHIHPKNAGAGARECKIVPEDAAEKFLSTLSACLKGKKPGEWVVAGRFQAIMLGALPITKETLDKLAPNNPVVVKDLSGHGIWANSQALKIAGVSRNTPNPSGGVIERDAKGEPTGIFRESAAGLIRSHIPATTPEQDARDIKFGLDTLLSYGITSVVDAGMARESLVAYGTLAGRGELKQHVLGCIGYTSPDFEKLVAERQSFARPNFNPNCVKVFVDGAPADSHTGALLEPYSDHQPNVPERGLLLVPADELSAAVTRWDKMGIVAKMHVAGDWAARVAIDAVEAARKANGSGGPKHQIAHTALATLPDVRRAKKLDAVLEYSPYFYFPSPLTKDMLKSLGPERMARSWPLREGFASGATVVTGSDLPVMDGNPWIGVETSITRKAPGGVGDTFGTSQAITLQQAIDMFTVNAARALGSEKQYGTLEAGKAADFAIIDRNPFKIAVTDIHKIKVEQTFIAGAKVYERGGR